MEILKEINDIGWFFVILSVVLFFSLIIYLGKLVKDAKATLGLKSVAEIEKEQTQKDLDALKVKYEALDKKLNKQISEVKEELHEYQDKHHKECTTWREQSIDIRNNFDNSIRTLVEKFDKYIEVDNRRTIATLRTSLWRLHKDFVEQKYVTPDGLKTWNEMGKVYVEAGGNDIFHDKLDPEVSALPIRYPEGSVYTHE